MSKLKNFFSLGSSKASMLESFSSPTSTSELAKSTASTASYEYDSQGRRKRKAFDVMDYHLMPTKDSKEFFKSRAENYGDLLSKANFKPMAMDMETPSEMGTLMTENNGGDSDAQTENQIPLDQLLNDEDFISDDEAMEEFDEEDKICFETALIPLLYPLSSKIDTEYSPSEAEQDLYASLIAKLKTVFDNRMEEKDIESLFNLYTKKQNKQDLFISTSKTYQQQLKSQTHLYYKKEDFVPPEDYQKWANNEIQQVQQQIDAIAAQRTKESTNMLLQLQFQEVNLYKAYLGGKDSVEIQFAVQKDAFVSTMKKFSCKPDFETITMDWKNEKAVLPLTSLSEPLSVVFKQKKGLSKKEVGECKIETGFWNKLYRLDQDAFWGKTTGTLSLKIAKEKEHVSVGDCKILYSFQYQKQQPILSSSQPEKQSSTTTLYNYFELYERLLKRIVTHISIPNFNMESGSGGSNLNSLPPMFDACDEIILSEYRKFYHISNAFHQTALLRAFLYRVDLMIAYARKVEEALNYFKEKKKEFIGKESNAFVEVTKQIIDKFQALLSDILKYFPRNKPKGSLEIVMKLYKDCRINFDGLQEKDIMPLLSSLFKQAMQEDYENISNIIASSNDEALRNSVIAQSTYTAKAVYDRLIKISCYLTSIPPSIPFEKTAIQVYYKDNFFQEVSELLNNIIEKSEKTSQVAFGILELSYELERIHQLMREEYKNESKNLKLINASAVASDYVLLYMKSLRGKLYEVAQRSLTSETPLPGVFHSSSVVDVFTAANQYFEVLKNLDFVSKEMLREYSSIVQQITLDYAKMNEAQCVDEMKNGSENISISASSNSSGKKKNHFMELSSIYQYVFGDKSKEMKLDNIVITKNFITKINNICAAKIELNQLVEQVEETSNLFVNMEDMEEDPIIEEEENFLDEEDEKSTKTETKTQLCREDLSDSQKQLWKTFVLLNTILNNTISVIVQQFQPLIYTTLESIVNLAKNENPTIYSKDDLTYRYGDKVNELVDHLLYDILDHQLLLVNKTVHREVFVKFLETFYVLFAQQMMELVCPTRAPLSGSSQRPSPIHSAQACLLQMCLPMLFNYFNGSGSGVSKEFEKKHSKTLLTLLLFHKKSSDQLIQIYKSTFGSKMKEEEEEDVDEEEEELSGNKLQPYHLLMILDSRKKVDSEARKLLEQKMEKKVLEEVFKTSKWIPTLNEESNETEKLLQTSLAYWEMSYGKIMLYEKHVVFEKNVVSRMWSRATMLAIRFDTIESIECIASWKLKGCKLGTTTSANTNVKHGKSPREVTFYFLSEMARDKYVKELVELVRKKQPYVHVSLSTKDLENMGGLTGVDKSKYIITNNGGDDEEDYDEELDEEDDSTILQSPISGQDSNQTTNLLMNKLMEAPSVRSKREAVRLGLPVTEQLVSEVKCSISRKEEGFLFIFSSHFVFESIVGQTKVTIPLIEVAAVEKKKEVGKSGRISVIKKNGDIVEFRRFLSFKRAYQEIHGHFVLYSKLKASVQQQQEKQKQAAAASSNSLSSPTVSQRRDDSDDEDDEYSASDSVTTPSSIKSQQVPTTPVAAAPAVSAEVVALKKEIEKEVTAEKKGKKQEKFEKNQKYFYAHFKYDPVQDKFFMATKAFYMGTGSGSKQNIKGKLYLSSKHVCFEPQQKNEKNEVKLLASSISIGSAKRGVTNTANLLRVKGNTLQILMRDASTHLFFVPKFDKVIKILNSKILSSQK